MSRVEFVLIGTDESYDAVSRRIAELLGGRVPGDDIALPGGGWASLDPEPFDPWLDERLQGYRWQLTVGGLDADEQVAAARIVYETLAAGTSWALALTYDHADALVAARSARTGRQA